MAEKIGDAILELRTDVTKLVNGMEKARKSADKGMKQMETRAEKFSKLMKGAAAFGGVVLALNKLGQAFKKVFDIGQYAAAQKQTSMAFKSIAEDAGAMADDIIRNMRKMSGETISELDMMLSANRASLLGIPVDAFDDLMAIARASATATGESVGKMFDDIVKGIGRGSPLILDNLGIVLKVEEAYQEYAKSIGTTASALTKAQQTQAVLNATLKSGEDIIRKVGEAGQTLTDVERWQQVTAAAADFKGELGMGLLPIMGKIFEATTSILRKWTDASTAAREYNELMKDGLDTNKTAAEQISILTKQLEKMNKAIATDREGGVNTRERDAIIAKIEALQEVAKWEELAIQQTAKGQIAAAAKSNREAAAAKELLAWLKIVDDAWADTEEGQSAALESQIAMFEEMSKSAVKTKPLLDDILEGLYAQRDVQEAINIPLEERMSKFEALSIMAAESYAIEKEAADAALAATEAANAALEDKRALMEGMASDTILRYGEAFGTAIEDGISAHQLLREAMKETVAIALEAQAKMWALEAAASWAKAWTNPANIPKAIGLTAASIGAMAGAGYVRSLATGGDFETRGPQMIAVGDNPGGRERVSVTPVSSPNINGPGQMMRVTVNLGSRTLYDDINRASENGDIIVHPRSIRK